MSYLFEIATWVLLLLVIQLWRMCQSAFIQSHLQDICHAPGWTRNISSLRVSYLFTFSPTPICVGMSTIYPRPKLDSQQRHKNMYIMWLLENSFERKNWHINSILQSNDCFHGGVVLLFSMPPAFGCSPSILFPDTRLDSCLAAAGWDGRIDPHPSCRGSVGAGDLTWRWKIKTSCGKHVPNDNNMYSECRSTILWVQRKYCWRAYEYESTCLQGTYSESGFFMALSGGDMFSLYFDINDRQFAHLNRVILISIFTKEGAITITEWKYLLTINTWLFLNSEI